MSLEVRIVRCGIFVETWSLDDILEHAAHIAINIGDAELTALYTLDDLIDLCGLSGLHQVVAGLNLGDGGQTFADTNPVGHHDTLIAPILTQNLGEQIVITHRELSVHLII